MKRSIGRDVGIVEYSKKVDFFNCLTHGIGAVLSLIALLIMTVKAQGTRAVFSAVVYGVSLLTVYTVSAVYHGLKKGEAKRRARILDHSAVPLLIAGTATPCALITLYEISVPLGLCVFSLGWFCAVFGVVSKLFFFEKLKKLTMAIYIISGVIMLSAAIPVFDKINTGAFGQLVAGGIIYVAGAVLCGLGAKKEVLHIIFHLFVMAASSVHFYAIYTFVF